MIDFVALHRKVSGYVKRKNAIFVRLFSKIPFLGALFCKIAPWDVKYHNFLDKYIFSKMNAVRDIAIKIYAKIRKILEINIENPYIQNDNISSINLVMYSKKMAIKWRRIAFFLTLIFAIYFILAGCNSKITTAPSYQSYDGYIANISISGAIMHNEEIYESLRKIRDNKSIKAVILRVNSPGGSIYPSDKMYQILRQIDKIKPVVTVMEGVAASGGYMVSIAGRYIFAMPTTITGSIGVYTSSLDVLELANKMGIRMNYVKSTNIKGSPHMFEHPSQEVIDKERELIFDVYEWFRNVVAERRDIHGDLLNFVSSGQVFIGPKALKYKLIDAIGDDEDAAQWLYSNKLVEDKLMVKKIDLHREDERNKYGILGSMTKVFASTCIQGIVEMVTNQMQNTRNDVNF